MLLRCLSSQQRVLILFHKNIFSGYPLFAHFSRLVTISLGLHAKAQASIGRGPAGLGLHKAPSPSFANHPVDNPAATIALVCEGSRVQYNHAVGGVLRVLLRILSNGRARRAHRL